MSTWRTLAEFVADGRAASVGVSNFQPDHLDRIVAETGVVPVVNQIEVHPDFFIYEAARAASIRHGIEVEAWSPIAQGGGPPRRRGDRQVSPSAHGKTASQVTLRWHLDRGDIVFPKSMREERMRENFDLFDFSLSSRRDRSRSPPSTRARTAVTGPNPDTFDWIP